MNKRLSGKAALRAKEGPATKQQNTNMKLIKHVNNAVSFTTQKTGAALRLGAGITGDVVGTAVNVVGGTVAIVGGTAAAIGFAVYAGGNYIMRHGDVLSDKSQAMAGRAYDDLIGKNKTEEQHEVAPEPPVEFAEFPPAMPAMG